MIKVVDDRGSQRETAKTLIPKQAIILVRIERMVTARRHSQRLDIFHITRDNGIEVSIVVNDNFVRALGESLM